MVYGFITLLKSEAHQDYHLIAAVGVSIKHSSVLAHLRLRIINCAHDCEKKSHRDSYSVSYTDENDLFEHINMGVWDTSSHQDRPTKTKLVWKPKTYMKYY